MDNREARDWLDVEWRIALASGDPGPDPDVDALVNAKPLSVRYALVTQLLGKIAEPSRSLFALQLSAGREGDWDARSFSTTVIVPWVTANQSVLGTSAEPYASKPLRRERLEADMPNVRHKADWARLVDLFERLDDAPPEELVDAFRRVLRSVVRRLGSQAFGYVVPQRISLPSLLGMLDSFLATASGGLRPQAVATALLGTLGDALALFSRVDAQGINESDAAGGVPGDIVCYSKQDDTELVLVVEVKDMDLTLNHVQATSLKAKRSHGLSNLLFAVPRVATREQEQIRALAEREWAAGTNIYTISIGELVEALLVLLPEACRVHLVRAIGHELDRRRDQVARTAWADLLLKL